ncbi:hypothetical protein EV361DRAFT_43627 [Lentinula raphanica]|nr:hypothetical protein EV361DRAFT_43627 [Lentinula raphanica]
MLGTTICATSTLALVHKTTTKEQATKTTYFIMCQKTWDPAHTTPIVGLTSVSPFQSRPATSTLAVVHKTTSKEPVHRRHELTLTECWSVSPAISLKREGAGVVQLSPTIARGGMNIPSSTCSALDRGTGRGVTTWFLDGPLSERHSYLT